MSRAASPTLRQRQLASRLREIRLAAGLKIEEVAPQVMISTTHLSRLETAARRATPRNVKSLCDFYDVSPDVRTHLMTLARDSEEPGWWQSFDLPYSTYVGLESSAVAILDYHSSLIPGLLQTERYAHAVAEGVLYESPPEVVARRVEARMIRQRLLTAEAPPRLWTVLDEATLHREVGGREVMAEQLGALADWAGRPNVRVQILPFHAGAHAGMDSSFSILQLDEGVPSFAHIEHLVGDLFVEKPDDLRRFSRTFDHLRANALNLRDSAALIAEVAGQHSSPN